MTARMYSLVSEMSEAQQKYVAGLKGQARIVFDELAANRAPRFAEDINKECGPRLVTRQDTLRVTLYYIIVLKGKGIVRATEPRANVQVAALGIGDVVGEVVEATAE